YYLESTDRSVRFWDTLQDFYLLIKWLRILSRIYGSQCQVLGHAARLLSFDKMVEDIISNLRIAVSGFGTRCKTFIF
ncbi:hypothetical protein, partial [Leptospira santarosai]|uniref:hypothetical protein n=1 Tax=Leptospira santarosai TaxID=28183 RepID=UPI0024AEE7F9